MKIYVAPVQGHTDAAWRHFHHLCYGDDLLYFTPFIRCEHGELRNKDIKDFTSPLNSDLRLEPQVIFRDMEELQILLKGLVSLGAQSVNLNMGCPFPLQTAKGRGAGFIANVEEASRLPEILSQYPDIRFSVKMRLGYDGPDEWQGIIGILNSLNLENLYVHPRVARQQYGGELHLGEFGKILEISKNPVVFNGDIKTPDDIDFILKTFPSISGVMVARGLLGRPSLATEYISCNAWQKSERIERMLDFHRKLLDHYSQVLCGDSQILSKIKPFWEYAEAEIGRKAWKSIRKASNLSKYRSALALIGQ